MADPVQFTMEAARRIASAVRMVENMAQGGAGGVGLGGPRAIQGFHAEITAESPDGEYTVKRMKAKQGQSGAGSAKFEDDDDADGNDRTYTPCFSLHGEKKLAAGSLVWCWPVLDQTDGTIQFQFELKEQGLFPVNLTKTGGSDGDETTKASWTYTAKDLTNTTTYGTVLTPKKQRPAVGKITHGDGQVGLGYWEGQDFRLYDANETLGGVQEC